MDSKLRWSPAAGASAAHCTTPAQQQNFDCMFVSEFKYFGSRLRPFLPFFESQACRFDSLSVVAPPG